MVQDVTPTQSEDFLYPEAALSDAWRLYTWLELEKQYEVGGDTVLRRAGVASK